ncbi:hypothetical protein H8E52_09410 [bacterium]|nr:hypothetical protein [bacterium]
MWKLRGDLRRDFIDWLLSRLPTVLGGAESGQNPESLTTGFARRFAPFKRAMLLLDEPDPLAAKLVSDEDVWMNTPHRPQWRAEPVHLGWLVG